jgi:hypothetical protein
MAKRYTCTVAGCHKKYTTKPNLLRHIRMIHLMTELSTEARPFSSRGTKYSTKGCVVGIGEDEYECPFPGCYKYYSFRSRLRTHLKKHKLSSLLDTTLSLPNSELFNFEFGPSDFKAIVADPLPKISPSRRVMEGRLPDFLLFKPS